MKDEKTHFWRLVKVFKALVTALTAGCVGGAVLTVISMLLIV